MGRQRIAPRIAPRIARSIARRIARLRDGERVLLLRDEDVDQGEAELPPPVDELGAMRGGRRDCERAELGVRLAEESVQPLERRRRVAAEGGHVRVEQPQREGHHRPAPPRVDGLVPLVPVRAAVQVAEHRHLARRLRHVAQLEQRDDPVPAETQQHVDRVRAIEELLGERAGRLPRAGVRQRAHALLRRRHVGRRRARR